MSAVLNDQANSASSSGLVRALLQAGRLPEPEINAIRKLSTSEKQPFIDMLLQSNKMSAEELANFCSEKFGYPLIDLDTLDVANLPDKLIDGKTMQSNRIVPIAKRGNRLTIAVSDPTQTQVFDQLKFKTSSTIEPVVARHDLLLRVLGVAGKDASQSLNEMISDSLDVDLFADEAETQKEIDTSSEIDDAPVVRYLQKIMLDAINQGASDIHLEPFEKFYRIRFRIDGVLREVSTPPVSIKDKLASRIKVLSRLDIAEKRVPQDGRMKLTMSAARSIDFRVSTLPTLYGEKIVLRILDSTQTQLAIDDLGYEPDQKEILLNAINRPYGMVLMTGPTGSGKTVSLYTCLNILNKPGINISTAEDPAEINLPGINQVNINEKAGLTFAVALRSFLRQDPDIVMVGEIRDIETAEIAVKAAQTGHMVFSTLHTNDAPSTLTRLINMGIAPFNIASSVVLITAQRLARRLCNCKKPITYRKEILLQAGFKPEELDGSWQAYEPGSCQRCGGSGYKGRVGIYQLMPISEAMERVILRNGTTTTDIEDQAKLEGIKTLRESGLLKVKQGVTSLEEVLGCTND